MRAVKRALVGTLAGSFVAAGAYAQAPAPAREDVTQLEKFVVTGSNIPTAADAVAVPVTIIGPRDIERTNINANLLEVIRKKMPFFAGNGNLGDTNANTGGNSTLGGSQVSLRNLDTLVLINGRRVATSGANSRGGRNFVDLNQFPISAVERIEVVKDGASAIYGSDAVGGVVNVILKKDLRGLEFGGRYATADGDYTEQSGYVGVGAGDDNLSLTISASWSKTDPLYQKDRPFSERITGRTASIAGAVGQGAAFPTYFLNSSISSPSQRVPVGLNAIYSSLADLATAGVYQPATFQSIADTFDLAPYVTLLLEQERRSLVTSGSYKISDTVEVFGDFMYSNSQSFSQLAAQPGTNLVVPAGTPFNPLTVEISPISARFVQNPRVFTNDADFVRGTIGARGKIGENWNWETAYVRNRSEVTVLTKNVLFAPNLDVAVAGGYDAQGNPTPGGAYSRVFKDYVAPPLPANITSLTSAAARAFYASAITPSNSVLQPALDILATGNWNPASLENIFGTSRGFFQSELEAFDVKLNGTPFTIYSGDIGVAAGFDYRTEALNGQPDSNSRQTGPTRQRWSGATFFDPFVGDRDITAYYVEARVPLAGPDWNVPGLRKLDLTAAYRWEDYSDAGKSDVPKYGISYQPIDEQLTLRYTYSESFTAPALYSLSGPTTQGFTANNVIPGLFKVSDAPGAAGINGQAQQRTGSNPNLRPSNAETQYYGIVYSPKFVKGLTLSVDYIETELSDIVSSVGVANILQDVDNNGTASPYAAQVTLGAFPGDSGASPITSTRQLTQFLRAGNSAQGIYVFDGAVNVAGQRLKALDISADYVLPTDSLGEFTFSTVGTFFLEYQFQTRPDAPFYEYAGFVTAISGVGSQGTVPDYRFYTTVDWTKGPWGVSLGQTFIPAVEDIGTGGATASAPVKGDDYQSWDISFNYTFKPGLPWAPAFLNGLRVSTGVNNVFDEMPPFARTAFNDNNVDISTYSPIGRLFFVRADFKF